MKIINKISQQTMSAVITDIVWERVHLTLYVKIISGEIENLDFYAVNEEGKAAFQFDKDVIGPDTLALKINITNVGEKNVIPIDTYSLIACVGETAYAECVVDETIVHLLEDRSRGFLYKGQNYAYNIKFYIEDNHDKLAFRMRTLNSMRMELEFPDNPKFFFQFARLLKDSFFDAHVVVRIVYRIFSVIYSKNRENNVLFLTEQSKTLKSNLKAVYERMYERKLNKKFKIRYSARKVADKTQGGLSWVKFAMTLAKSGVIFVDDHVPALDWLKLGSDVKVFQLWHAGAGFKSSGYSRWGQMGPPGPISAHRQYLYGISGSKHISPFFSEVWGINDENVIPTGMPRMDHFLDPEFRQKKTEELKKKFPVCKKKKVILFAPTYRGNSARDAYYPYDLIDFEALRSVCADKYVVFFKMHPWVIEDIVIPEKYKDVFFDVKNYSDINDLFYITDLLITDYSSNIFEFSLMKKPMLFFAFDKIQYAFSRGFHRPYEESAPGKVVYSFEELLQAISEEDFEIEKVYEYIEKHFDYIDSGASDRVIDWLLLGQLPENIKKAIDEKDANVRKIKQLDFSDCISIK